MLNTPSDYKYTIPETGIIIDGGIMPARDVANDGSWKILRGEDPCFLSEAARRCKLYRRYCDSKDEDPVPVGREVTKELRAGPYVDLRGRLVDAARGQEGEGQFAMPFNPTIKPRNIIALKADATQAPSVTWQEVINGSFVNSPLHSVSISGNTPPGDSLLADYVRSRFYDFRKLGKIFSMDFRKLRWSATPTWTTRRKERVYNPDTQKYEIIERTLNYEGEIYGSHVYEAPNYYKNYDYDIEQSFADWELRQILPADFQSGDVATALNAIYDAREPVAITALFAGLGHYADRTSSSWVQFCIPQSCHLDDNGIVTLDSSLTASEVRYLVSNAMRWSISMQPKVDKRITMEPDVSVLLFSDPALDTTAIPWRWTPPT